MSRLIERAFEIAKNEMGIKEVDGSGNHPRIIEYLKAVDFNDEITLADSIPWCAAFANWCIQKAGGKGTRSATARSFLAWGKEVDEPNPGDIVVFKRGRSTWQGHVAFVVEVNDKYVTVCGGNQSDSVCYEKYRKTTVLGYRTSKD